MCRSNLYQRSNPEMIMFPAGRYAKAMIQHNACLTFDYTQTVKSLFMMVSKFSNSSTGLK